MRVVSFGQAGDVNRRNTWSEKLAREVNCYHHAPATHLKVLHHVAVAVAAPAAHRHTAPLRSARIVVEDHIHAHDAKSENHAAHDDLQAALGGAVTAISQDGCAIDLCDGTVSAMSFGKCERKIAVTDRAVMMIGAKGIVEDAAVRNTVDQSGKDKEVCRFEKLRL